MEKIQLFQLLIIPDGPWQLKQENEELKAELQLARERDSKHKVSQQPVTSTNNDMGFEKNMLRQELHSLQVQISLTIVCELGVPPTSPCVGTSIHIFNL